MTDPRLDSFSDPAQPRAIMLLLHGGQEHSEEAVRNKHASWWRMAAMARSLRGFADDGHLSMTLLQYRMRGWNGSHDPAPVRDARWALDQVTAQHPGLPVVLVGHSMGGRTACRVADDPRVVGVVALAPWLPEGEPNGAVAGRHLRVLHGSRDNWTSAFWSRSYVERSRPIAASATWESLPGAGHFMFRRPSVWRRFVEDSVSDILDNATSHEEASSKGSA
ncbi:alpha/beta fold hydrolase [Aeromicrobium stalagmiti]|uniref:alpha/beta fold hydrolase n=1 Tax=Aeromicrobium stalagmiti TaxID=2738988 RepID=UPI001C2C0040